QGINGLRRNLERLFVVFDGFGGLTFFIKSNGEDRVTVCVIRLDQQSGPRMLNGSIERPSLKQSVAETITGKKVIGTYCHRFLVVNNRVVDSFLLQKSVGKRHLGIWIIWLHPDRFVTIENCLVHLAFAQKGGAKIVIGIPKVRLHFERRPVMPNRVVKLVFSE